MDCTINTNTTPVIVRIFLLRIILSVCIFLLRDVSPVIKIIAILSLDFVKTLPFYLWVCDKKKGMPNFCTNDVYQVFDKLIDLIGYWICYSLLLSNNILPKSHKVLFLILLIRTIGVALYFCSGKRIYLFFGVDLFKEWLLIYAICTPHSFQMYSLLLFSVIGKLWIEYRFHVQKKGLLDLFNK